MTIHDQRPKPIEILDSSGNSIQTLHLAADLKRKLVIRHRQLFERSKGVQVKPALVRRIKLHDLTARSTHADASAWAMNVMAFLGEFQISPPPGYLAAYLPKPDVADSTLSPDVTTLLAADPTISTVREIRSVAIALETGYRKTLYQILQKLYIIAEAWRIDTVQWRLFTSAPDWQNRKNPPSAKSPDEALHYIIRFVFGMDTAEGNQRANKFSRALTPLFEKGVPASEIIRCIEAGGGLEMMSKPKPDDVEQAMRISDDGEQNSTSEDVGSPENIIDDQRSILTTSMAVPQHLIGTLSTLIGKNAVAEISIDYTAVLGVQIKLRRVSDTLIPLTT